MIDKIELLDMSLLDDKEKLREIDHWLKVFNWPNGWHYDLDIIWVLKNIEKLGLPKGSTIIDAGAGLGITQFILATRGYNVISIDFGDRQIPSFSQGIFKIERIDKGLSIPKSEYLNFMTFGQGKTSFTMSLFVEKLTQSIRQPAKIIYYLKNLLGKCFNIYYFLERIKNHAAFGKIIFLRATFNNMTLEDNCADVLISISAFEHNAYEDMPASIREFERVLKKGASMLITTSAADKKDWYFQPCRGWNFSYTTLSKWFNITENKPFDFSLALERIKSSKLLKSRISPFYKYNADNGLPYARLQEAKYVPVGIRKTKV